VVILPVAGGLVNGACLAAGFAGLPEVAMVSGEILERKIRKSETQNRAEDRKQK
jgi:hypothetical protein